MIEVRADDDGVIEGSHVAYLTTSVDSDDTIDRTVGGTDRAGRRVPPTTEPSPARTSRGYLVRMASGAAAGQVRSIWDNYGDVLVVEQDWDAPVAAGDRYVIIGYTDPVSSEAVVRTVAELSRR